MKFKHFAAPYVFLGYQYPFEDANAVVIQVPYDSTTTYRPGTRNGPHSIIMASRQLEAYDVELGVETADKVKIHTLEEVEPDLDSPKGMVDRVEDLVSEVASKKKFPLILGGEHSISTGAVRALRKKYPDLSVLQIDAHSDLRDKLKGSPYDHGCVMRRIREEVDKVVQVGIRAVSREEMEFIESRKIENTIQYGSFVDTGAVLKNLSDNVYVSIDLDGFDPSVCPGVGTPEPGGLGWEEVVRLLRAVCENRNVVGFDIVELAPLAESNQSEFMAAKLAYKMLGYSLLLKK